MRVLLRSLVLVAAVAVMSAAPDVAAVRVWQGSTEIPTYSEGPPTPNAPFESSATNAGRSLLSLPSP